MRPLVTVVVPVWDRYCELLSECLQSVVRQDVAAHIVVVDNASSVPLPPLPRGTEVVVAPERVSVGAARNLGLTFVRTPYVLFLDADDALLTGAIRQMLVPLAARPELVSVLGRFTSFDPRTGAEEALPRMPRPIAVKVSRHRRLFALANLRFNCFLPVGSLHRTDVVAAAGGFGDGNVGEDWVLCAQLALRGQLQFTEAPVFRHRVEEGSLWHRRHTRKELGARCRRLRERIRLDGGVPWWAKALLPVFAVLHAYDVRRATPGGELHVSPPALSGASE